MCAWHWGCNSEQNSVPAYTHMCVQKGGGQTDSEIRRVKIGMLCLLFTSASSGPGQDLAYKRQVFVE